MIRLFYDTATAEPATQVDRPNIAALMAKHGVNNDTENPVATPISITPEKKEEPKPAPEATPAVTATEPQNAEPAKPESPSQPAAPVTPAEPQKEPVQVKVPTLQEVLKQHQPDAIFKEIGVDADMVSLAKKLKDNPKMAAFFNHWETNGDVKPYLKELSTDYANMSPEEVMRHQLQKDYPKSSQQQIEALYRAKVVRAYNLESTDEDEKNEGMMLLQAEAERHREGLVKNQQEYLLPPKPEPKVTEPDNSEQVAKQQFEAYQSDIQNNSYTKGIFSDKKMTIGAGDDKFTFPLEKPEELLNVLFDDDKWQETQFDIERNPDGSIKSAKAKTEHQLLTAAVAKYGMAFMNQYAQHYKSLGGKSVTTDLENPSQPGQGGPPTPDSAPKTAAEAMARGGTYNSGGYNR